MSKKLSQMTLEELWQLFPVILTEHNPQWKTRYAEEEKRLKCILPNSAEIFHIGSTAIEGIWAKPIIDILVELNPTARLLPAAKAIEAQGYIIMSQNKRRISLNKGYTEKGFAEKVFHLHLQHTSEKDEVLFRDYLNLHPETAKEYERLKLSLCKRYEHDRDAYTNAKSEFVKKYTALAKADISLIPRNDI